MLNLSRILTNHLNMILTSTWLKLSIGRPLHLLTGILSQVNDLDNLRPVASKSDVTGLSDSEGWETRIHSVNLLMEPHHLIRANAQKARATPWKWSHRKFFRPTLLAAIWKKHGAVGHSATILRCQRLRRTRSILRSLWWNFMLKRGAYSQPSAASSSSFACTSG